MAAVPKLLTGEALAANNPLVSLLNDLVEEQERLAVGDSGFDFFKRHVWSAATARLIRFQYDLINDYDLSFDSPLEKESDDKSSHSKSASHGGRFHCPPIGAAH